MMMPRIHTACVMSRSPRCALRALYASHLRFEPREEPPLNEDAALRDDDYGPIAEAMIEKRRLITGAHFGDECLRATAYLLPRAFAPHHRLA